MSRPGWRVALHVRTRTGGQVSQFSLHEGSAMEAAVRVLRRWNPAAPIVAVPDVSPLFESETQYRAQGAAGVTATATVWPLREQEPPSVRPFDAVSTASHAGNGPQLALF